MIRAALGLVLGAFLALTLLGSGCRRSSNSEQMPELAGPRDYADSSLGFSFQYLGDWTLRTFDLPEGIVAVVTSPDGAVSVQVVRDFPPPTAEIAGYGPAMVDMVQLSLPDLKVDQAGTETLKDGTPAYRARFSAAGEAPRRGELLIIIRGQEAFLVQAAGPEGAYEAWTGGVRTVLDSFRLTPA